MADAPKLSVSTPFLPTATNSTSQGRHAYKQASTAGRPPRCPHSRLCRAASRSGSRAAGGQTGVVLLLEPAALSAFEYRHTRWRGSLDTEEPGGMSSGLEGAAFRGAVWESAGQHGSGTGESKRGSVLPVEVQGEPVRTSTWGQCAYHYAAKTRPLRYLCA